MALNDVDKLKTDWLSDFIYSCDGVTKVILRAHTELEEITSIADTMSQAEGGFILLGAYNEDGYGSGFESVEYNVIEALTERLNDLGIYAEISSHKVNIITVYFIEVKKHISTDNSPTFEFIVNETCIDPNTPSETQNNLARYEFLYSIIGFVLAIFCIVSGVFLFITQNDMTTTDWTFKVFTLESILTNGSAGVFCIVVGFLIIFFTRYKFKHHSSNK
ncbi:hypothetical protein [Photobacterium leiognathi]|uniref:hypothetical protein n=1 Tax=Photobacterium leiognathi TaxID=553611 RepID=UPI0029813BA2|nr:hypothetical protein [Photobacterium leiognathi]